MAKYQQKHSHHKFMFLLFSAFSLVAVATTMLMVQQNQDNRQSADFDEAKSFGNSLQLSGEYRSCLYRQGSTDVNFSGNKQLYQFTFEGWFMPDVVSLNNSASAPVYLLSAVGAELSIRNNRLRFEMMSNLVDNNTVSGTEQMRGVIIGNSNLNTGWHHFAVQRDGLGNIKLYLDGKEDATPVKLAKTASTSFNTTALYIGCKNGGNAFKGEIDEFSLATPETYKTPTYVIARAPFTFGNIALWRFNSFLQDKQVADNDTFGGFNDSLDVYFPNTTRLISSSVPASAVYLQSAPVVSLAVTPTITPRVQMSPTPAPTAVKWCKAKFSYANTTNAQQCIKEGQRGSAKTVRFGCSDGYAGTLNFTTCVSTAQLNAYAKRECEKRSVICK